VIPKALRSCLIIVLGTLAKNKLAPDGAIILRKPLLPVPELLNANMRCGVMKRFKWANDEQVWYLVQQGTWHSG